MRKILLVIIMGIGLVGCSQEEESNAPVAEDVKTEEVSSADHKIELAKTVVAFKEELSNENNTLDGLRSHIEAISDTVDQGLSKGFESEYEVILNEWRVLIDESPFQKDTGQEEVVQEWFDKYNALVIKTTENMESSQ